MNIQCATYHLVITPSFDPDDHRDTIEYLSFGRQMKTILFLVKPMGLTQVHFLGSRFLKKKFMIKSSSFFKKSANIDSL